MSGAALALASSLCFGAALVTSRIGLRALDARSGAAISVPTAMALFVLAAPFALDVSGFDAGALAWFAVVGLFFPAAVTIVTFRANETLGPTVTGAVSGTAPVFALAAAALLLGEAVPPQAAGAALAIGAGIAVMSWQPGTAGRAFARRELLWPLAGALLRGFAQAGAKAGLTLWPNPFAAGLVGYLVSSATVLGVDRLGGRARAVRTPRGIAWFALTGALNGSAVLAMYAALNLAPVSLVAPLVATYPLVTALASALLLRDEPLSARVLAGAAILVAAVAWLMATAGPG